jgi:hypothetical protein
MNADTKALTAAGFTQHWPHYTQFTRNISRTKAVKVSTAHRPAKNDFIEDAIDSTFVYKVTKINLPNSETKLFKHLNNAIQYANQ